MNLQLMRLRKRAGYRSRKEFAKVLGMSEYTYKSWETGTVTMSLEQAYNVAVALNCTLNDLVGMESPSRAYPDPRQRRINDVYESVGESQRQHLYETAQLDALAYSKSAEPELLQEAQ